MTVFLDACQGKPTPYTPIWLNRQAGRYMPEYHTIKGNLTSLEFFKNPEQAAKVTLEAQRVLGVDAAIVFTDLLPILEPMGFRLDYQPGVGPVFENPVLKTTDVDEIPEVPANEGLGYVARTIRNVLADLPSDISLIGFAGAPFTLASYAIEGRSSRDFVKTKSLMYQHEETWHLLMHKLTKAIVDFVELQIQSGVHAIQIFDSWVGTLSCSDYDRFVRPHTEELFQQITGSVPIIYFAVGNNHLLKAMQSTGPDFLALDWRSPLDKSWSELGTASIQGNLDPIVLCSDTDVIQTAVQSLIQSVRGRDGHIFNLGHGIIPQTPVDHVKFLVDFVHEHTSRAC